ncbi:MAG: DUF2339 domain-containing protein [Deltaproteobacteria bacterium]|nr:DUF2339 domain-containing protein [Deltaproteobacteria bacterium]
MADSPADWAVEPPQTAPSQMVELPVNWRLSRSRSQPDLSPDFQPRAAEEKSDTGEPSLSPLAPGSVLRASDDRQVTSSSPESTALGNPPPAEPEVPEKPEAIVPTSDETLSDQKLTAPSLDATVQGRSRPDWLDEPHPVTPSSHQPVSQPAWLVSRLRDLGSWLFLEGNIWVSVGVTLFLAGFGLLFNYMYRKGWIPIEYRLIGASLAGIAMIIFGWRRRETRRNYALILQGGGIGILYVTLVAGVKFGPVIPVEVAILGLLALSAFTIVLAWRQEFEPLALFALLGGYAAPLLVRSGNDNFLALFFIQATLNFEVWLISLLRDWRKVRWSGLVASVAVGLVWGALRWSPDRLPIIEPFLIFFFLNYSAIALIPLYANRLKSVFNRWDFRPGQRVDSHLVNSLPFVFLTLQIAVATETRYGVSIACLALGGWHLALGILTHKSERARQVGCSAQQFMTYGWLFANLAIPYAFRSASSAAIWAIEGALLLSIATKQRKTGLLVFGLALHLAGFIVYSLRYYPGPLESGDQVTPSLGTGLLFVASALASSYFLSRAPREWPSLALIRDWKIDLPSSNILSNILAAYGTIWLVTSVWKATYVTLELSFVSVFTLLCLAGAAGYVLASFPSWRANGLWRVNLERQAPSWSAARILAGPPILMALLESMRAPLDQSSSSHLGATLSLDMWTGFELNWLVFALMFVVGVMSYRSVIPSRFQKLTWSVFLLAGLTLTANVWRVWLDSLVPPPWAGVGGLGDLVSILPLALATAFLTLKRLDRLLGLQDHYFKVSYLVLVFLTLTKCPAIFRSLRLSESVPYWYFPIFNPVELKQLLFLAIVAALIYGPAVIRERSLIPRLGLFLAIFIWLNDIAARSALRYFGEWATWGKMTKALYFQGIIAILWGVMSLVSVFIGKKYGFRRLWFAGAGLLGLDIIKLLLVDLSNSATVIRIFAFLILGGLILIVGWVAPLPPANPTRDKLENDENNEVEDASQMSKNKGEHAQRSQ